MGTTEHNNTKINKMQRICDWFNIKQVGDTVIFPAGARVLPEGSMEEFTEIITKIQA
jgi:hypothetical protein